MSCKSCRSNDFVFDDTSGMRVCSTCGVVQDFDNYQHQYGGISGPQGTFVRFGTTGVGTDYSYKERKLYQSDSIINDITFRLDFTVARTAKVKEMVDKVTASEFGLGEWFSVLVGACSCIVMRMDDDPLPIAEVADAVACELYEMGKMISRVVQFLGIQLPEFDIVGMLERMIRNFPGFKGAGKDKLELMVQQGNFILQCTIKWFLTTGRRPGPVAVAVLVFVAKLNGFQAKLEEVAKEANLVVHTCKKRYNELLEVLVKVARKLPWGDDVNVKNILKNAPFVLKYMEMKSREKGGAKRKRIRNEDTTGSSFDVEELLGECLSGTAEYGAEWKKATSENDPQQCSNEGENPSNVDGASLSMSELESLKVSHEALAQIHSKFSNGASMMKLTERGEPSHVAKEQSWSNQPDLFMYDEWWTGRSELCRRLMTEEITVQDVGLESGPPSYTRGCQQTERRKHKIEAAKTRISSIACQPNKDSNAMLCIPDAMLEEASDASVPEQASDASVPEHSNGGRKRRKTDGHDLDWEDLIIETLLLHQVKEDEIQKGYYNTLLDLHVFNSGIV